MLKDTLTKVVLFLYLTDIYCWSRLEKRIATLHVCLGRLCVERSSKKALANALLNFLTLTYTLVASLDFTARRLGCNLLTAIILLIAERFCSYLR